MPPTEVKEKPPERDPLDAERFEFTKAEEERRAKEERPPEEEKPGRKGGGELSRQGMEAVIKAGGSVIHRGKLYQKVEELPDEATLVEGDTAASAAATASIDAQMAALASQRAALEKAHAKNLEAEKKKGDAAEPKAEDRGTHPHKR